MLNYYYKNGIHHFNDEETSFNANGGWTKEYYEELYYSVHTKRAEYLLKKDCNYITVITTDNRGCYYNGKLHGVRTETHKHYDNLDDKYFIEENSEGEYILEIKNLLDSGKIY